MTQIIWFTFPTKGTDTITSQFPKRGTIGSAGYDLYSDVTCSIPPQERKLIQTNVGVILPHGTYGRIAPRSSLAYKYGIDVFAGVIDSDYRERIGVILYNSGNTTFEINRGDRIAQLIVEKCVPHEGTKDVQLTHVGVKLLMGESFIATRDGGFGSTGK